ncbi:hypothetical protein SB765_33100, partial [Pseudomonas sp. SIMBA_067]
GAQPHAVSPVGATVLHHHSGWRIHPLGAGVPAKNAPRGMAPATPVFAAVRRSDTPAATVIAQTFGF